MLVLSRHRDERIMIGEDVVVTVVDIRGDKVRLGIEAPMAVPVHRQEVYDEIKREGSLREPRHAGTFVFGVVMQSNRSDTETRISIVESVDGKTAILRVRSRFNDVAYPPAMTMYQCFGESGEPARAKAALWMFEQWVAGAELIREVAVA